MEENRETINNVEKSYTDPVTGKFVKGNPGGGRPKGTLGWAATIAREAEKEGGMKPDGTKLTKQELVARKLVELAVAGDMQAIKEFGDRTDGKPRQNIGLDGGDEDKPIPILYVSNNYGNKENTGTE